MGRRTNPEAQRLRRPVLLGRHLAPGKFATAASGGPAKRNAFRASASASRSHTSQRRTPALAPYAFRSEEHTSELQSLMRISYAVFCLKKKNNTIHHAQNQDTHSKE